MKLSHLNAHGEANMVDVGEKHDSLRIARAQAMVQLNAQSFSLLTSKDNPKGDVLSCARIAGIMATKRTSELIPLCHPLLINKASIDFEFNESAHCLYIFCEVRINGKTGVEMEALTGVNIAALTIYDMLKAVQKDIVISNVMLLSKLGGRSSHYQVGQCDES